MTALVLGLALTAPAQPPFAPPGRPVFVPPAPVVVQSPGNPGFVPVPAPALTVEQFSRWFAPTPGRHHVTLIHPKTNCPVEVCFTLPACGPVRSFKATRHAINFDFGKEDVSILFRHNGTVDVKYH